MPALLAAIMALLLALGVGACGGGGDSGLTEDEVAGGLNLRFEGNDILYTLGDGRTCIVFGILTSADEVEDAEERSGDFDTAVATSDDGTLGIVFGGFTGFSPNECVSDAEQDLNTLQSD